MLEMVKNRGMLMFIVGLLLFTYIYASKSDKLEESDNNLVMVAEIVK